MCGILAIARWAMGNDCVHEQLASGYAKGTFWWELLLFLGVSSFVTPFYPYLPKDGILYRKDTVLTHLEFLE